VVKQHVAHLGEHADFAQLGLDEVAHAMQKEIVDARGS